MKENLLSHTIVVGKRGVITLPSKIRDALGIDEGTALKVVVTDDCFITIQPIGEGENNNEI
jgi:AbrB family looped-hinge helix DNA binding protein